MNLPIEPRGEVSAARPQVLMLTHRVPYPPDRGDRIRSWNILRHLAVRADVSLGCICDEPISRRTRVALESVCRRVAIAPVGSRSRWFRAGTSAIRGRSLTEGLFWSPRLARTLEHWADCVRFDAALVYCSSMLCYTKRKRLADIPKVVDLVDADSQKWRDYAANAARWKRPLYRTEARRIHALEKLSVSTSRAVTLVSDAEAHLLKSLIGDTKANVLGLSNGVDTDYFDPDYLKRDLVGFSEDGASSSRDGALSGRVVAPPDQDGALSNQEANPSKQNSASDQQAGRGAGSDGEGIRPGSSASAGSKIFELVFVGALDYHPNVSGLQWFVRNVWPALRQSETLMSLKVVGRNPIGQVRALGRADGIEIVGSVADVRPYIAAAGTVIAPLQIARGIQNKVLEAMAMSKAVIASPQAAEGIDAVPEQDFLLADSPESWVSSIVRLSASPDLARQFGSSARKLVLSKYNWSQRLRSLDELLGLNERVVAR